VTQNCILAVRQFGSRERQLDLFMPKYLSKESITSFVHHCTRNRSSSPFLSASFSQRAILQRPVTSAFKLGFLSQLQQPPLREAFRSFRMTSSTAETKKLMPPNETRHHEPPPDIDYSTNATVFGKILRGELPARVVGETTNLMSFLDIHPHAPFHALVIPKRFVKNIGALDPAHDVELVREMKATAETVLQEYQPKAYANKDYLLCFHVPPFTTVSHLHVHVVAPVSQMSYFLRRVVYHCGMPWSTTLEDVLDRLEKGQPAVDSWLSRM